MMRFVRSGAKIAVLAVVGVTALAACGSSKSSSNSTTPIGPAGAFGTAPAQTGTPHAGTITVALPPGAVPNFIMPLVTAAANSVYNVPLFGYQMWRPLYWEVNGVEPKETPALSLANEPTWTNNDTTVTFTLKSSYKWSDGKPITSKDVLFWYDELKAAIKESPANSALYTPGLGMPDEVASVTAPNVTTVVFTMKKSVNPSWFTENQLSAIQPMPSFAWAKASASGPILDFTNPANAKKIYDFITAQNKSVTTYASNPMWQIVNGPYKLTSFNNTTGAFTMAPNAGYGGPHTSKVSTLQGVPFTSDTAEFNAVKAGSIDQGYIPLPNVPQVDSVKSAGYNVFGYPDFGWSYIAYNFKDTTGDFNNLIGQLYIRQAIAHLEDEAGYIKAFFFGAGGQAFGPVPSVPASPYTPANGATNPFPFSTTAAEGLLKSHGWTISPGGTDVCATAGTGSGQCGAGIPKGTKLAWTLIANNSPTIISQQDTDLASQARKIGMQIHLSSSNFNYMIANYNNPAAPKNINKWAMEDFGGFTNSTYPTTFGVFNTGAGNNIGSYSDPAADTLIKASLSSSNPSAVKDEAAYLTAHQPGLFQPNPDLVMVWKKTLSGPPATFEMLTQYQMNPELWYFTK